MLFQKTFATLAACAALASIQLSAQAGEVRIGTVSDLSGPLASTSIKMVAATQAYLDMINAKGGINGNKIVLMQRDDQYDPRKTPAMVEDIITRDNVVALVNSAGTANTFAMIKAGVLSRHKVPLVGVFSGSEVIRGPGSEYIFHTRPTYHDEVMKIARVASTLGVKNIAVLFQEDGFGASIMKSVNQAMQENQFKMVAEAPYKPGETDFSAQAKKIIAAQPQAIFLMGVPDAVANFMKVYDAPVGAAQIYTLSFVTPDHLQAAAGEARIRGIGITQVVPNANSAVLQISKDFQAFLKSPGGQGVEPNPLTFESFVNLKLVLEAIRLAGPNPTAASVAQSLKSMRNFQLGGLPIDFSETNRSGSSFLDIAVVGRNGRLYY
ncbi:MAG: ABC transporter substrate-binding protein [Burkholderiaceae bacterium]